MDIVTVVVLGVIQGITEFLPISSDGHLTLAQHFFGLKSDLGLVIVLHLGSLLAILITYFRDLLTLLNLRRREIPMLIVGTLPAVVVGLTLKDEVEEAFSSATLAACLLVINGVFLWIAETKAVKAQESPVTLSRAFVIGLAQVVAMLPGISRSGMTIGTAVLRGIRPVEAVRFSFFLGAIAIAGACTLDLKDRLGGQADPLPASIWIGVAVSFAVSLGAIHLLRLLAQRRRLRWFAVYCWIAGGTSLILLLLK